MGFLKSLGLKIKNFGVSKCINALDLLEPVLASRIESAKKEVAQMNSQQMATYLIDLAQEALREHFKIKP